MNNFYELAVEMEGNDVAANSLEIEVKVCAPARRSGIAAACCRRRSWRRTPLPIR